MHPAIYDPRASATPSQAQAANQRLARLRRIGSRARPDSPIVLRHGAISVSIEVQQPDPDAPINRELLFQAWVDRQRERHAESLKKVEAVTAALAALKPPSIELIQKVVAAHYGTDWRIMFAAVRTAKMVRPRQVAMYLSRAMAGRSLPEIGRRFGGRDHSTIHHAFHKMSYLIERDAAFAAEINTLKSLIAARSA